MRPRVASLALVWLAAGGASSAAAQPGDADGTATASEVARSRLDVRGGLGVRHDTLTTPATHVDASGAAVSDLMLGGAWFSKRWPVGVTGQLEVDRFGLRDDRGGAAATATGFEALLALAGRLLPTRGALSLEGALGYGFVRAPVAGASGPGAGSGEGVSAHGPALGVRLALAPSDTLAFELAGRAFPVTFGGRYDGTAVDLRRLAAGLGASVGRVAVGDVRLSGLVGYEVALTNADAPGLQVRQLRHQFGIGLRVTPRPPARLVAQAAPVAPLRARLRGTVRLVGGEPIAGAEVTASGARAHTDQDGTFSLAELPPGLIEVSVVRADLVPATEVVSMPATGDVTVQFTLRPVQAPAPAVLSGLVRSETGAPIAARVRLLEPGLTVDADAAGRFRFEVPAGRYTLTIEAAGFITQRKAVRAGAGEQNIYNVDLQVER